MKWTYRLHKVNQLNKLLSQLIKTHASDCVNEQDTEKDVEKEAEPADDDNDMPSTQGKSN